MRHNAPTEAQIKETALGGALIDAASHENWDDCKKLLLQGACVKWSMHSPKNFGFTAIDFFIAHEKYDLITTAKFYSASGLIKLKPTPYFSKDYYNYFLRRDLNALLDFHLQKKTGTFAKS